MLLLAPPDLPVSKIRFALCHGQARQVSKHLCTVHGEYKNLVDNHGKMAKIIRGGVQPTFTFFDRASTDVVAPTGWCGPIGWQDKLDVVTRKTEAQTRYLLCR